MILICLCAGTALLAGCGEDGDGEEVVATTAIAADIARQVAEPDADVAQLLPGGASPHGYSASAKERAELEDALLVVAWGAGLEEGLPLDDVDVFELSADDEDPHVWMDPTLVAEALPELAVSLGGADPDHAAGYNARAEAYAERLRELDARVERMLASVPSERRKLVTTHDSLGHFAARYGFEVVGAPFGTTPESEPSAERVAELVAAIERQDVPAVFAEAAESDELIRRIADEAGVEVVDDLLIEGFGGEVESYEELLLHDARLIADALAP